MAYATLSELRSYLFAGGASAPTVDDALLTALLARAQALIDAQTGRKFESVAETRKFDLPAGLYLPVGDLLSVTTLTNGDGQAIPATAYALYPENALPKRLIFLLPTSGYAWQSDNGNSAQCISVAGTWGYSASPPNSVKHAAIRLAAWLYRQKDNSNDVDRPIMSSDGTVVMPAALPRDVEQMIAPYVRRFMP